MYTNTYLHFLLVYNQLKQGLRTSDYQCVYSSNRLQAVNVTCIKLVQFKYKMNTLTNLIQLSLFVSK